jgi:hypothetical protein
VKPTLVLVTRTTYRDAYRYARYVDGHEREVVLLDPTPMGKPLPVLSASDVELFRTKPEELLK